MNFVSNVCYPDQLARTSQGKLTAVEGVVLWLGTHEAPLHEWTKLYKERTSCELSYGVTNIQSQSLTQSQPSWYF